jgi:diaminohydroxyphosphoribosylaminopyrimidine deaminase / 5-amino-6-(5-phosphoribosylamino)uracil reductase
MAEPWELAGMRRAIILSAFGLGTTSPNPPVGCVVFDASGSVIGEGFHERKGEAHAETRALAAAGPGAAGGIAVVTLEPCNHSGRTPPCRAALLDAGIRRVVIAVLDPTSRGDGGATELRKAGLSVEVGVCEQEARLVLGPWLAALDAGRPTVTWAYEIRDDPGTTNGAQVHDPDERTVAELRAGHDVVLFGDGRIAEGIPGGHGPGVFTLPTGPLPADPNAALTALAAAGTRTVLLAGDRTLAEPFLSRGLVDGFVVHGWAAPAAPATPDGAQPPFDLPAGFAVTDVTRVGTGLRITGSAGGLGRGQSG